MPRKLKLTFQKGTSSRAGRWRKIYRGKTYYVGTARSKSDLDSYKSALEEWKSLKLKIDSASITIPESLTQDYYDVIREWELVLSWAVQNGDDEEAVISRTKLTDLRERLQSDDPAPISRDDRLWSRFRLSQEDLNSIGEKAMASANSDLSEMKAALENRQFSPPVESSANMHQILDDLGFYSREEIKWQERIESQKRVADGTVDPTLAAWIKLFREHRQKRVAANELSAGAIPPRNQHLSFFKTGLDPILWLRISQA